MKSVVFIGHNDCFELSRNDLNKKIIECIENGATLFYSGGQGGFDRCAAVTVSKLKTKFPNIKNILVIPYLDFNIFDKEIFDEIIFPEILEKCYFKTAIPKRNKYMVDNSDIAICYIHHGWGNAINTFNYAKKKNLKIINLSSYNG